MVSEGGFGLLQRKGRDERAWVREALRQRCVVEDNIYLSDWQRWAYALKAAACIILGRYGARGEDECDFETTWYDGIAVAVDNGVATYSIDWGSGRDWDVMAVGRGLRNWWYEIGSDGYP